MSTRRSTQWLLRTALAIAVGAVTLDEQGLLAQQGQPTLQITSPQTGTLVRQGDDLNVTITALPATEFRQIITIAERPIDFITLLTAPPFHFTISIPRNVAARSYYLLAFGVISSGQAVYSDPITINVVPASPIVGLSIEPTVLAFDAVGEKMPIRVIGRLADGTTAELTESTLVAYTSQNPAVATVSSAGVITAAGPGNTQIFVNGSLALPVSVPVSIRGDLDGNGDVDRDDLNILLGALNTPATTRFDARDLNGDGIINALDARILATLCTRDRCATQ